MAEKGMNEKILGLCFFMSMLYGYLFLPRHVVNKEWFFAALLIVLLLIANFHVFILFFSESHATYFAIILTITGTLTGLYRAERIHNRWWMQF